jgi:hypothetical protein
MNKNIYPILDKEYKNLLKYPKIARRRPVGGKRFTHKCTDSGA